MGRQGQHALAFGQSRGIAFVTCSMDFFPNSHR